MLQQMRGQISNSCVPLSLRTAMVDTMTAMEAGVDTAEEVDTTIEVDMVAVEVTVADTTIAVDTVIEVAVVATEGMNGNSCCRTESHTAWRWFTHYASRFCVFINRSLDSLSQRLRRSRRRRVSIQ